MVDIFSKSTGPRREDVAVKRLIEQNRGVIAKLADQISGGQYSRSKKPRAALQPEGLILHIGQSAKPAPAPEPRIRVTPNGRVIAVDISTGRQLQYFGVIRTLGSVRLFRLATAANGFMATLDAAVCETLADIDGVVLGTAYSEADLAADIGLRTGMVPEA